MNIVKMSRGNGKVGNPNGSFNSTDPNNPAVLAQSDTQSAVRGVTQAEKHSAVMGVSECTTASAGAGVYGKSKASGVIGESETWHGVAGISHSETGGAGVFGKSKGAGVIGESETWHALAGVTESTTGGAGVYGKGGLAGLFEGNVRIDGNIAARNLDADNIKCKVDMTFANADVAEDFRVLDIESVEPGCVMVLAHDGSLCLSQQPFDKRVAGVISGAGNYKPGIVLDKQDSSDDRFPIALIGKVYCKVDAQYGAIEVGDLLTTSPTAGHAMKADDPLKAFGAVLGKALRPLVSGQGLIPVLIALQ